jgi:hypothetical protein
MTREQLEHVIRAAAAIAGEEDIVVIGGLEGSAGFGDKRKHAGYAWLVP